MDHQTGTGRRQFLKRASLLVAGTQAGALLPSAAAAAIPGAAKQAKPLSGAKGSDPVVDTSSGKVRGTVQDGIRVFKGIPVRCKSGRQEPVPASKEANAVERRPRGDGVRTHRAAAAVGGGL